LSHNPQGEQGLCAGQRCSRPGPLAGLPEPQPHQQVVQRGPGGGPLGQAAGPGGLLQVAAQVSERLEIRDVAAILRRFPRLGVDDHDLARLGRALRRAVQLPLVALRAGVALLRVTGREALEGGLGPGDDRRRDPRAGRLRRLRGRTGILEREIEVPVLTLNAILSEAAEPIDFVSIDVEGSELAVLQGFDLQRFAPRVLIIEDNSSGTDRRVSDYLAEHGYVERFRVEQNAFYTRREDDARFGWST